MKATYQWDFAGTSCLSEMPILRAMEANTVLPKPPTPGLPVLEVPPAGGDEHCASDMQWLPRIQDIGYRGKNGSIGFT